MSTSIKLPIYPSDYILRSFKPLFKARFSTKSLSNIRTQHVPMIQISH